MLKQILCYSVCRLPVEGGRELVLYTLHLSAYSADGSISVEQLKLLLSDKHVRVVLINIFGGITRCDDVAKGILEAFATLKTDMPIVIRLTGTNEKEGRELLKGSQFTVATTMGDAGKKAVELAAKVAK